MDSLKFLLHLDTYLESIISAFGPLTYVILFLIIFAETGLVVTPFLPGDSLLFIVGTLSGGGFLNIWVSYVVFLVAAFAGDTANYWIGHHFGPKVFSKKNSKLFNPEYLEKTRTFYAKYGGKTIILARFLPIIRTFAPFVAGIGKMHYGTFVLYNIVGAFVWVTFFTFAGYFFGGIPLIKNNFEYAVVVIVLVSILPVVFEYVKHKMATKGGSPSGREKPKSATFIEVEKTFKKEHLND